MIISVTSYCLIILLSLLFTSKGLKLFMNNLCQSIFLDSRSKYIQSLRWCKKSLTIRMKRLIVPKTMLNSKENSTKQLSLISTQRKEWPKTNKIFSKTLTIYSAKTSTTNQKGCQKWTKYSIFWTKKPKIITTSFATNLIHTSTLMNKWLSHWP